ncbi:MAG: phosphotransferase family protein [Actinobacteria bacterium]|nr:phosphotransferase family protein [Actinomycetota bacterium]MBV9665338.1 phosphotransferase family protein [Actinomycetota bacterium]
MADTEAGAESATGDIEGINVPRVTDWLVANVEGVQPPFSFELIAGGRSNLTFRVTDAAGRDLVLRRPPISHVLPTAHDMGREFRIISALQDTPVPVAPSLGFCDDESVNERPFYVMGYVDGYILRDAATAEKVLDEQGRRRAGESIAEVMAAIHAVDVDKVGLGDLGRREGYIERQLKRWYSQFKQSSELLNRTVPLVDEVHDFLAARIPEQGPATIVHGDYRLDNTMLGDDGNVKAVLDWEICTLGDPLADVGLLMVYWADKDDDNPALGVAPTATEGFPSRAEVREIYAATSGRDVAQLDFYVAFGYWKLACILEGVYSRYVGGAGGGDRSGVDFMGDQVVRLSESAKAAASSL